MNNLQKEPDGSFYVAAGAEITSTIAEAITMAAAEARTIVFEFNGVTFSIDASSNPELLYRDWSRGLRGYIEKSVGPNPNPILTDDEKAHDALIKAENERRREAQQDEYGAESSAKRIDVFAKLFTAPPMEVSDEAAWQSWKDNNRDGYGAGVITFAERWARLMQIEMAIGRNLEDVASTCSHEADLDGITGFMYGAAVSTLASSWKYGDQLRRWHNLDTQIGDEGERANNAGGILNPAILNIG